MKKSLQELLDLIEYTQKSIDEKELEIVLRKKKLKKLQTDLAEAIRSHT